MCHHLQWTPPHSIPYNTRTHAHSHRQTQTQTFAHTRPIFYLSIAKSKRFQIATHQKNDFSSLKFAVFVSLVSSSNVSFLFSVHFGQREVEKKQKRILKTILLVDEKGKIKRNLTNNVYECVTRERQAHGEKYSQINIYDYYYIRIAC